MQSRRRGNWREEDGTRNSLVERQQEQNSEMVGFNYLKYSGVRVVRHRGWLLRSLKNLPSARRSTHTKSEW